MMMMMMMMMMIYVEDKLPTQSDVGTQYYE